MALTKDLYVEMYDITLPNCYWKISERNGIVGGKNSIRCIVECYRTQELASTPGTHPLTAIHFSFTPDLESPRNFIAQGYDAAKLQPVLIDSIDC